MPWLLHLAVMGRAGLGSDEAHYALYAWHLDWSYFDHPPLVGWMQAAVLLVSSTEFALRVVPLLFAAGTAWLVWRLTPKLFPDASPWVGVGAVALLQSAPGLQLQGMALVPEVPLVFFALLVVHLTLDLLERDTLPRWLLLGAALGLAGLSKYTAVTLAPSLVWVFAARGRLDVLRRPGPWLAVAVGAALVSPVLVWNQAHDWISFRYQIDHGTGGKGWEAGNLGQSQAGQLGVYGPVLFLGAYAALVSGWRERRDRGVCVSLAFAWPVLLLFGYSSGKDPGLPHWTALAFVVSAPLTARWLAARWERAWLRRACLGWAGFMVVFVLFLHSEVATPWAPFPDYKDPTAALTDWDEAAARSAALLDAMAEEPGPPPRQFIDNWTRAGRLAWYGRPRGVSVVDKKTAPSSQFDLWYGQPEAGDRGILVVWDKDGDEITAESLKDGRLFEHCELVDELPVERGGRRLARFLFFEVRGYVGPEA